MAMHQHHHHEENAFGSQVGRTSKGRLDSSSRTTLRTGPLGQTNMESAEFLLAVGQANMKEL